MSRILKFFLCLLLSFYGTLIHAEAKHPADISYMVSDFKYSQEHGLKICEVQQGALSALNGDLYINGGDGNISPMIASFFDPLPLKKWVIGSTYSPLKNSLIAKGWELELTIKTLSKNPTFLDCASQIPNNPSSIASYGGIVYAACDVAKDFNLFRNAYPGVLFIDAVTFPYWVDKYKMNILFNQNAELKEYKAEWELYPKKYDPGLSGRIQEKMPSELYVIKPRREFLGNGVIVVADKDLDSVLQMILEPQASLKKHPDKSYSYWSRNKDDTFLIEKYYTSDCLHFSHKLSEIPDASDSPSEGKFRYDATMRIAFILEYDGQNMTYHSLGGFWKLPYKALEEKGTLNEHRISFGAFPFYRAVEPELLKEANAKMEKAMLLLYEVMLNAD